MYGKARESLPLQELNPDITTFILQVANRIGWRGFRASYFLLDDGRTVFPICLLYSAISMGEQRNSGIS